MATTQHQREQESSRRQDLRRYLSQERVSAKDLRERAEVLSVFQKHHECSRCGRCCVESDPIGVLGSEVLNIARHLGLTAAEFRAKYISGRIGSWLLINKVEGAPCPFLDGEPGSYRCTIYPVRPYVCQAFPFLSHITIEQSVLPLVAVNEEMCPNMLSTYHRVKEARR